MKLFGRASKKEASFIDLTSNVPWAGNFSINQISIGKENADGSFPVCVIVRGIEVIATQFWMAKCVFKNDKVIATWFLVEDLNKDERNTKK